MKLFKFSILLVALTLFVSCNKDDNSDDMDDEVDIQQLVENFVTPELLQSLRDLGFNFNDGQDTPNISGIFAFNPVVLQATNIPSDFPIGSTFFDLEMNFSNLNPETRTFDFVLTENNNVTGETQASFYSGNGNEFTAYVRSLFSSNGDQAILLYAITGTIEEEGITNATYALIMLDNMGNSSTYIENGQGRLFRDDTGTADRQ